MFTVLFSALFILFLSYLVFWPFVIRIKNTKEHRGMHITSIVLILLTRLIVIIDNVAVILRTPEGSLQSTVKATLLIMTCSIVSLFFSHVIIRKEMELFNSNLLLSIAASVLIWIDFFVYVITG